MRPDELHWWWTNQQPPEVTLSGPAGPVRMRAAVQITLSPVERAAVVEATMNGAPIPVGSPLEIDTSSLPDGQHRVRVVAEDRSRQKNRSEASIDIHSDNTPPTIVWDVQPSAVPQGSAAIIRLRSNEPTAVEALTSDRTLPLNIGNGFAWTIMSFGPEAQTGVRTIELLGRDLAGNESRSQASFQVAAGEFLSENVQVPVALARLLTPEFRHHEETRLREIYAQSSGPPRWTGRFRIPVEGQVVTDFGTQRAYNGGPTVGHHAGVDIAAPAGAPVLAAQAGRVALVDELTVRGMTLVLDHGHGIYSTYAHLQDILVEPNAQVEAGQRVARVGNTGLSTGPHLHWEIWVGGAMIEPLAWTKLDLP